MPLKLEITCDACGVAIDLDPKTIYAYDSPQNLCDLLDWIVISVPENYSCTKKDVPEKQYFLCPDCDEEEFYRKSLHPQCSSKEDTHQGTLFLCQRCGKTFCHLHFPLGMCEECAFADLKEKIQKHRARVCGSQDNGENEDEDQEDQEEF